MPAPHLLAALLATPTSWLPVLRAVQTDSAVVAAAEPRARAWTLLHFAAWDGKPAYAALLLERGANPAARDAHGSTPLHVAAARDAPAVLLRALTLRPALVEARDDGHRTPVRCAAALEKILTKRDRMETREEGPNCATADVLVCFALLRFVTASSLGSSTAQRPPERQPQRCGSCRTERRRTRGMQLAKRPCCIWWWPSH